tara:strand:- start:269 stop:493 length:225 start_codon:yes stop_codon:yes gene_type:complete
MKSHIKEAKKRWGKRSEWISGDGQYALLAWCRVLTVTLWKTLTEAEESKKIIDKYACGGVCNRNHEIINLNSIE